MKVSLAESFVNAYSLAFFHADYPRHALSVYTVPYASNHIHGSTSAFIPPRQSLPPYNVTDRVGRTRPWSLFLEELQRWLEGSVETWAKGVMV